MKAFTLMMLRISTGLLLVIWGLIRVGAPEQASGMAQEYYSGLLSGASLQPILGGAEVGLGILVCLGLFRKFTLPAQALVLCVGALMIWQHLLDPLALWLVEEENRRHLFFPSLCVAFATITQMLYKEDDAWSLDRKIGWNF